MRTERLVALALVLVGLLSFGRVARADDVADAQAHYKAGRALYDAGSYDKALVEFEAAQAIAPRPLLLYHLARTHRSLGHLQQALELFQQFVAADPANKVVADANAAIAAITDELAKQASAEPPPAAKVEPPVAVPADQLPPIVVSPPVEQPPAHRAHRNRWVWLGAAAAAFAAGLVLDLAPGSAHNGQYDALDFAPAVLYTAGTAGVLVGLLSARVLAAAALLPLAGCALIDASGGSARDAAPADAYHRVALIPLSINPSVDILFVIDNSGSMLSEQAALISAFPAFLETLDASAIGRPDLHLGIVTTDLGAGPFDVQPCDGSDDGALQGTARGGLCPTPTGVPFISDLAMVGGGRNTNYTGPLEDVFACIAPLGTAGCGFVQPLAAARRALDNPANAAFLRPPAHLALLFLSDGDDCSVTDDALFDPNDSALGALSTFRCFEYGVDCADGNSDPRALGPRSGCVAKTGSLYETSPATLAASFLDTKGPAGVTAIGVLGDPTPVSVRMPNDHPELDSSCTGTDRAAEPSIRMQSFFAALPGRTEFASICDDQYDPVMERAARAIIRDMGLTTCLSGNIDTDPGTPVLEADCHVYLVTNPDQQNEQRTELEACSAGHDTPCYGLDDDASCDIWGSGVSVGLDWGGVTPPADGFTLVECR